MKIFFFLFEDPSKTEEISEKKDVLKELSVKNILLYPKKPEKSSKNKNKKDVNPYYCATGPLWRAYHQEKQKKIDEKDSKKLSLNKLKSKLDIIKKDIANVSTKIKDANMSMATYKAQIHLLIVENKQEKDPEKNKDFLKQIDTLKEKMEIVKVRKEELLKIKNVHVQDEQKLKDEQRTIRQSMAPLSKKIKKEQINEE